MIKEGSPVLQKIIRRALATVVVLIGVSIIAFLLVRLAPGDPAKLMLPDTATEETIQAMREKMGTDKPLFIQYLTYMKNVLKGDLGTSYHYNRSCSQLIFSRLPSTAKLAGFGMLLSLCFSIPLGMIAGIKKGSFIDTLSMFFAMIGQSMSHVWLGLMLILIFAVNLKWLPSMGTGTFKHMIMPAIVIGFQFSALATRMVRFGMIDVLQEDYITATRAKGISKFKVYTKYAFKNALLPVVTVVGSQVGAMMSGSMVIETVFSWPGIGSLTTQAIYNRDYQLIQSILLISATIFVVCNLLVDILYTFIDPRISFN